MSAEKNLPSAGREFERGFGWTLALSTAAHVLILGGLLLVPGVRQEPQPKLQSYSVDLVDPNKLGGTNLIAGSKGKSAAPPKVEPAKAKAPEPPPPPPAEPEPPPPAPPDDAKPEPPPPPKEAAKPPEPPKEEPKPDERAIALDRKVESTPTPVQIAKVEPPTIAPTVAKPVPPTAAPTQPRPRATNTIAKAQATHTSPAKAVGKAKTTPTQAKAAKGQPTPTKAPPQAVAKANASPVAKGKASPGPKAAGSPSKAGASPGTAKSTPGVDPKARDDRIAAAIKRIEEQAGTRGGGAGGGSGDAPGGPISIGPGEGAGGEVRGVAFIMYTNRLEAMIKEKWVWAGQDPTLRADIAFNILSGGEVVNVRTVASSGDANYDRRAETAVRAAAPFPPPPAEYQAEFETVGFVYTFEPN